ncbi:hypothetical protein F7D09_0751 [Bifidobacterium leontopitheci]|uniref:Uncharacterized protein n=2 Tax=Bifidobacterium leontopitheci TaxID=2650774 RepID=A0A6I1GGE2_9BIFI|nr:hypothetical protein F7D09_0751 [Bifidobacterium leontopitheci]
MCEHNEAERDQRQLSSLRELNERFPIPGEALAVSHSDYAIQMMRSSPDRGQIWLLCDDENAEYALVLAIGDDPRTVVVTAMSNDVSYQTDESMVIHDTPLGMPMVVWPKLTIAVPMRLLKTPCGKISEAVLQSAIGMTTDAGHAVTRGKTLPGAWRRPKQNLRAKAARFVQWHRMIGLLPQLHQANNRYQIDTDADAYFDALMEIGLPPYEILRIRNGERALTDGERAALESAGYRKAPTQRQTVPDEYLIQAERPRWREIADALEHRQLGGRAESSKPAEPHEDVRLLLARTAFTLAARSNGHDQESLDGMMAMAAQRLLSERDADDEQ